MATQIISTSLNQINHLTTSNGLIIHRQKIGSVCVIGQVMQATEYINKFDLILNDYTGMILVEIWKSNIHSSQTIQSHLSSIKELDYCRVVGRALKNGTNDGFPFIIAYNVEPLKSLNELSIHMLEIVKHSIDLKKLKIKALKNAPASSTSCQAVANYDKTSVDVPLPLEKVPEIHGLTPIEAVVLNFVKESENGLSANEICKHMPTVKREIIFETIQALYDNDHLELKNGIFNTNFY